MRTLAIIGWFCLTALVFAQDGDIKRYLYISHPDKAQGPANNTPGYMIFDIDNEFAFVRRVEFPVFGRHGGLRGFEASLANKSAYYTTEITLSRGLVGRIDLVADTLIWEKEVDGIGDRASVTIDGTRLFIPTGWWHRGFDAGNVVVDAVTGEFLRFHQYGSSPHNSFVTPNGKYMLMCGAHWLVWMDVETEEPIHQFGYPTLEWDEKVPIEDDLGDGGVSPLSVDSKNEFAYFSYHDHVGFDIVDLKNRKIAHHVTLLQNGNPIPRRTHGVGLTVDETEVWISDENASRLVVFDNTVNPPEFKQTVSLSRTGHGWIYFTRDGKYCVPHTRDIIDVQTKETVYTLRDENGLEVDGSKFFEAHFQDDELVWVSKQFGVGYAPLDTVVSVEKELPPEGLQGLGSVNEAYVYRMDGRLVKEVLNHISDPDQLKYGLPEGLYYIELRSGSKVRRRKIMVMDN